MSFGVGTLAAYKLIFWIGAIFGCIGLIVVAILNPLFSENYYKKVVCCYMGFILIFIVAAFMLSIYPFKNIGDIVKVIAWSVLVINTYILMNSCLNLISEKDESSFQKLKTWIAFSSGLEFMYALICGCFLF